MNSLINKLINYGLNNELISQNDIDYSVNLLLDLFDLNSFEFQTPTAPFQSSTEIIEAMLDYAVENKIIENNITQRDLFDTRIMNCLMPRPQEVIRNFNEKYEVSPEMATDYFYKLSIASNYIRKNRTDKNIRFKRNYKYGEIEITINLSKPEKDPKEIAKAKMQKSSGYPKCLLCKENVGFRGDLNRPARQNHRIIPLELNQQEYYLQYSPYVYYDEHCIVFNKKHKPMVIGRDTFISLVDFLDVFPHYMVGSNADLPIVGGSILSHDHFQGGRYHFPIEDASVIEIFEFDQYPNSTIELMNWPLSTIRITTPRKQEAIDFAEKTLNDWRQYQNEKLDILAFTGETPHNTITPISRKKGDNYQIDLVLRNNRATDEYPEGIFHPHRNLHAVKKENIGLIEVMGMAVLPARLKDEISLLKDCLLGIKEIEDIEVLEKHQEWYQEIKTNYEITNEKIDGIMEEALTKKFVNVLEDAGVFKLDDEGIKAFREFVLSLAK